MPNRHDENYVKQAVKTALDNLMSEDFQLLKVNANERAITHKFAEHLSPLFPTWHVDCEYNRDGNDPKSVHWEPRQETSADDEGNERSVYPDIIIHEREAKKNLLVIEVKKDTNSNPEDVEVDKRKLVGVSARTGVCVWIIRTVQHRRQLQKAPIRRVESQDQTLEDACLQHFIGNVTF